MQTVVLVVHLILALLLILVVLMQRSEGGGLGMGGGGGGGGAMTGRQAANALTKLTWVLAAGFLATSLALTIIAARNAQSDSVIERLGTEAPAAPATAPATAPAVPEGDLLPPAPTDSPATPPKAQ